MFPVPLAEVPPLTEKPSLEYAINAIKTVLNEKPRVPIDSEEATKFLEALKNSVFAWETCNELLLAKDSLVVSYIAANTLRQKINRNFTELPAECHTSLKESILNHLQATDDYAIQGQLSSAIADLTLLLQSWQNPIEDLSQKLRLGVGLMSVAQTNPETIFTVLNNRIIFAYIMHQMCDLNHNQTERPTRIGARRREEYEDYLISKCDQAIAWWLTTLKEIKDLRSYIQTNVLPNLGNLSETDRSAWEKCTSILDKLTGQIYLCYSAWLRIFDEANVNESLPLLDSAFKYLSDSNYIDSIHEYAAEAIDATTNYCQDSTALGYLVDHLVSKVYELEGPFKQAINSEDTDKLTSFVKVITSVADMACLPYVIERHDFRLVDLMLYSLMGTQNDILIAERTYPFWWTLLEHIQHRLKRHQHEPFIHHINKFVMLVARLCEFDEDEESVVPSSEDIHGFRADSRELITNLLFVTTVERFIRDNEILQSLSHRLSDMSWTKNETLLYLISCLAQMLTRDELEIQKQIFDRILSQQTNNQSIGNIMATKQVTLMVGNVSAGGVHPQIVSTTLKIIGSLEDLFAESPDHLALAINYVLAAIGSETYRTQLIEPAAEALCRILEMHASRHLSSCPQLLVIIKDLCSNLDQFDEDASGNLLRCSALMADAIRDNNVKDQFLCEILRPLLESLKTTLIPPKREETEPTKHLDRLSSIFRQLSIHPTTVPELKNFITLIDLELWPVILKVLEIYASEKGHAIERTCRTIRYILRCIKPEWMIERIAETMINLYKTYPQNSSPLYICSILVDEFSNRSPEINRGLFNMLEIFCTLTFTLLNMNASQSKSLLTMKNYPETIDDMMRLFNRFMKRCPNEFVTCKALESIIELSISSLRIDHHDANTNVSKFVTSFIALGQNPDYSRIGDAIRNVLGARITDAVIKACLFDIPSFLIGEEAQILMTLHGFDKELFGKWVEASVSTLPTTNIQGIESVTAEQVDEFKSTLITAGSLKKMVNCLRAHARLYS